MQEDSRMENPSELASCPISSAMWRGHSNRTLLVDVATRASIPSE
jgi:hypothetical protein